MNKKIIVLNGSPRTSGNTKTMIDYFIRGAQEANNEVVVFNLNQMNIHGCLGCCHGGKDYNSPCVQKDDMLKIYPKYREADIVVLASPLYYWTISGQLKTTFDRLFAVAECNEDYSNPQKDAVLLMAAEGYEFEESKYWYENLLKHLEWKNLGEVLIGGVMNASDINNKQEELKNQAAEWFHAKWGVSIEAYFTCMTAYLTYETELGWYLCFENGRIIGGLGVIENDFHDRKDLTPNVCAVYTEEEYRSKGIAGKLLDMVVEDMRSKGITPLYLVTDHIGFYERYGWEFFCMVQGDGELNMTRMYIHR